MECWQSAGAGRCRSLLISQLRQQTLCLTLDKTVCLRLQFPACERGLNIFLLQRPILRGMFIHDRETVTQGGLYRHLVLPPAAMQGGGAGYEQCPWEGGFLPARVGCSCRASQSMAEIQLCHLDVHIFFSFPSFLLHIFQLYLNVLSLMIFSV